MPSVPSPGVTRRQLLRRTALLTAAAGTSAALERNLQALAGAANGGFARPLHVPTELTGDGITVHMRRAKLPLKPGPHTRLWTFNGEFPGPTIRRRAGHRTHVTFVHDLGHDVDDLTIHLHGAHNRSRDDGQPERFVIQPGSRRTYIYEFREDGRPERGALRWYHDHSHMRTFRNVYHGLAGMMILDDGVDEKLGLPVGRFDIPLLLADRVFDDNNQLTDPFISWDDHEGPGVGAGYPPGDDVPVGDVLVNGVFKPFLDVEPRRYRFRVVNASPFRPYNLRLGGGTPFAQVGTDGGLLPRRIDRDQVLIGPGERAEVVVDFADLRGKNVVLSSAMPTAGATVPRTDPIVAPLMQFRVDGRKVRDRSRVPARLRPLPRWVDKLSDQPQRAWVFGLGVDPAGRTAWTINGRTFDPERVDAQPQVDSLETWLFVNASPTNTSHYIHIHDVPFKVLSRNGMPPSGDEIGLKDTFRLDPGEVLVAGTKFSDHLGIFMLHCHMLNHEDHGMMTTFEVVKNAATPTPTSAHGLLERTLRDPAHRRNVQDVVVAASAGRPAPDSMLRMVLSTAMCSPDRHARSS